MCRALSSLEGTAVEKTFIYREGLWDEITSSNNMSWCAAHVRACSVMSDSL